MMRKGQNAEEQFSENQIVRILKALEVVRSVRTRSRASNLLTEDSETEERYADYRVW